MDVLDRILAARDAFELSQNRYRSGDDVGLHVVVHLLQDAIELFLIALASHVKAPIKERTSFDGYFNEIEKKISWGNLPFRDRLLRLNRIRVNSKHYGIRPARDELNTLSLIVAEFLEECSLKTFKKSFFNINFVDCLEESEPKTHLVFAYESLCNEDYYSAMIESRKALYLLIEKDYDIYEFRDESSTKGPLGPYTRAPLYARSAEYIKKSVYTPFDFIVYAHDDVDRTLTQYGVRHSDFWNVWRLTPDVYRWPSGKWIVLHELSKTSKDHCIANANYVFTTVTRIAYDIQESKRFNKYENGGLYWIEIETELEAIPVFRSASDKSDPIDYIPSAAKKLATLQASPGLDEDDQLFWFISTVYENKMYFGYLQDKYLNSKSLRPIRSGELNWKPIRRLNENCEEGGT